MGIGCNRHLTRFKFRIENFMWSVYQLTCTFVPTAPMIFLFRLIARSWILIVPFRHLSNFVLRPWRNASFDKSMQWKLRQGERDRGRYVENNSANWSCNFENLKITTQTQRNRLSGIESRNRTFKTLDISYCYLALEKRTCWRHFAHLGVTVKVGLGSPTILSRQQVKT